MLSLSLGLIAALCWGIHDICVRFVSQQGGILPALTAVFVIGAIILLPVTLYMGGWQHMTHDAYLYSAFSGIAYLIAAVGLYNTFGIGPVRLVAPIVAAYPILSIGWAALSGQPVTLGQWIAVGLVICGVGLVSFLSDSSESAGRQKAAISWAVLAAVGFACAFAIGQLATQAGSEMPVILVTRLVATLGGLILLFCVAGPKLPAVSAWPLLGLMGLLDATALGIVIAAGSLDRPEFAAVAASIFGIVTIVIAWIFLKERMTLGQWIGVAITFAGIGYLAV